MLPEPTFGDSPELRDTPEPGTSGESGKTGATPKPEVQDNREDQQSREAPRPREARETRETQEGWEAPRSREARETRETRETQGGWEAPQTREVQETREDHETRDARNVWESVLDRLEEAVETAARTMEDPLAAPRIELWSPPREPLPAELAARTERLIEAQKALLERMQNRRQEAGKQMGALRRVPGVATAGPSLYLDVSG